MPGHIWLEQLTEPIVEGVDAHCLGGTRASVQFMKYLEISNGESRFRQHRDGRIEGEQAPEHAFRQPIAALAGLVGIGRRAHGDRISSPATRGELAAKHVDDVRLDDDALREVVA